jgi:hypothetical protein
MQQRALIGTSSIGTGSEAKKWPNRRRRAFASGSVASRHRRRAVGASPPARARPAAMAGGAWRCTHMPCNPAFGAPDAPLACCASSFRSAQANTHARTIVRARRRVCSRCACVGGPAGDAGECRHSLLPAAARSHARRDGGAHLVLLAHHRCAAARARAAAGRRWAARGAFTACQAATPAAGGRAAAWAGAAAGGGCRRGTAARRRPGVGGAGGAGRRSMQPRACWARPAAGALARARSAPLRCCQPAAGRARRPVARRRAQRPLRAR